MKNFISYTFQHLMPISVLGLLFTLTVLSCSKDEYIPPSSDEAVVVNSRSTITLCEDRFFDRDITVMTYNVQQNIPTQQSGDIDRILQTMPEADIIVFEEAFKSTLGHTANTRIRELMVERGLTFQTENLGSVGIETYAVIAGLYFGVVPGLVIGAIETFILGSDFDDGGVFIASRFPLGDVRQIKYMECTVRDCNADKGAIYARVTLGYKNYIHVFGTHLNAGESTGDNEAREDQLNQLASFVTMVNRDFGPTLICGDMNSNFFTQSDQQYANMLDILNVTPSFFLDNPMGAGRSTPPPENKLLDYILVRNPNGHQGPWADITDVDYEIFEIDDASDHYPVTARFFLTYPIVEEITSFRVLRNFTSQTGNDAFASSNLTGSRYRWRVNGMGAFYGNGGSSGAIPVSDYDSVQLWDTTDNCMIDSRLVRIDTGGGTGGDGPIDEV